MLCNQAHGDVLEEDNQVVDEISCGNRAVLSPTMQPHNLAHAKKDLMGNVLCKNTSVTKNVVFVQSNAEVFEDVFDPE